jgi:predicted DsbA family dithiol-disulfide isomerase
MHIDIVSDVVCPWCYVGKRRLEKALALRPGVAVTVAWRPFQLNPDMPDEGIDRREYLAAKLGGMQNVDRIHQTIERAGASVGIAFAFDRIRRAPPSRHAHRLIRFAQREGRADQIVEALFRAYFTEGRNIGDRETLVEIAAETGLDDPSVRDFLATDAELDAVLAEDRSARRIGINAVPCFIFDRQYALSGAQEPEFFLPVLDLARNGEQAG